MLAEQWLTRAETTCGAVPKSIELLEDRNSPAVRMRSTGNTYEPLAKLSGVRAQFSIPR